MTPNLFKESSRAARVLSTELRNILEDLDPMLGQPLLDRMSVEAHPTPLLVFTGYHSAGKSTLIEALTNRAFRIPIGSGVTTDKVTEYDWDGDVRLVDTPGVHADRPGHDELAERALAAADLVLFAVPVELFDDVLVTHLRDVLGRLAKSRQTLIVITKAGTMDAAPGHREAAIKDALGSFEEVPWVECDAQYYLDGLDLSETSPSDSQAFIQASGLAKLSALINSFASRNGELGRLSQPLQLLVAISLEASALLTEDPSAQAALSVLARHRLTLSKRRIHLSDLLSERSAVFCNDAIRAATEFADAIERDEESGELSDVVLSTHTAALNEALGAALERFRTSVKQVLEIQFDDLASEVLAIAATPYGRIAGNIADPETADFESQEVLVRPGKAGAPAAPRWRGDLSKYLNQFGKFWGAGSGVKGAAGSNGHGVVLKIGHAFGKKFKPWEAVKAANSIGKAAKVGGAVVGVGLEAYGVYAHERAAVKAENARNDRRRSVTQQIMAQAEAIVTDAIDTIGKDLDGIFRPEFQRIDAMAEEIQEAQSTRTDLRDRLVSIRAQASSTLVALASSTAEVDQVALEGEP
ncbi:GTPase domain-containing protein [uncultured Williamsia sp.]|uniref:GTPase domain-containing protein n=1 Tax=uncultured Williamsia sp. TaxID=259311 RepID=UPI0026367863|nr:GTPase domain-containing protein [uncultured Williamsia sp.]